MRDAKAEVAKMLFEKVEAHLLSQMSRSVDSALGLCMYRGAGGKMCAVGCLIDDAHYSRELEGAASYNPLVRKAIAASQGIKDDDIPNDMLDWLQELHDGETPHLWWRNDLARLRFNLEAANWIPGDVNG